ncbi:DNA (cytosine-5)-methyltransferase 3-like [Rhincodon typus]|uniref:DNA (cytosine-5)-methyltransferase 3-like n=1 Tax=Rhincodon typus TaxID=259920 RepID=UPI00202DE4B0|nr:DNA (cytosine-5)-methyltransferase 3-like [Rhincodon typus]
MVSSRSSWGVELRIALMSSRWQCLFSDQGGAAAFSKGGSILEVMGQNCRGKDQIVFQIKNNKKNIEEICISCGSLQVITQHPLFEGGLCDPCKDNFLETMFLYDQDGYQSFCTICCGGTKVLMCGNSGCKRCYCCECLDALVKPGAAKQAEAMEPWVCFMCCSVQSFGVLRRKRRWQLKLKQFFDQESDRIRIYAPVPIDKQNPIRVLSLFSNMTKDLQDIGILDRVHNANQEMLTFLKDLDNVTRQNIEQKGPFDFVIGVCQEDTSVHHCSGRIIFQYYRILQYARPKETDERPFFWIFVDPEILTQKDIKDASRFLECDPVIIHDSCESAVRLWSNIPSLKSKFAADMYDPAWENRRQNSGETCMKMVKQYLVPLKDYFKSYF